MTRLARIRLMAGTALAGLTAAFIGTHFIHDPNGWILFLRAVSGAGMIGGMADWFAVEAIFRHPFRLPIPHTALLRNRKDQAADNIGRFIEEYILVPEQISENIQALEPTKLVANWLSQQANSEHTADLLLQGLKRAFETGKHSTIRQEVQHLIAEILDQGRVSPAISALVADIVQKGVKGNGFTAMLEQISALLDQRRTAILTIVQENSRWWVASSVDRKVAGLIVDAVIAFLKDLGDPNSELHRQFEGVFTEFVADLEASGTLNALLDSDEESDAFSSRLTDAGFEMLSTLFENTEETGSMKRKVSQAVHNVAQHLLDDDTARNNLDARLKDLVETTATQNRAHIGRYVAKTLKEWDTDLLIERFESELGPDLQFIRINGTVLGATIGGLIFASEMFLS